MGLAAGIDVGGIMAYEFEEHVWEKVLEVIKKERYGPANYRFG